MERGNLGRLVFIGLGIFFAFVVLPKLMHGSSHVQPLKPEHVIAAASTRPAEQRCDIWAPTFHAQLSSASATLTHFELLTPKYWKHGRPIDLSTTPDVESRRQLRLAWRNPAVSVKDEDWLVPANLLDFRLASASKTSCEFVYESERVEINQKVSATGRPYELSVEVTIKNRASRALRHAL